jgi:hypothetical protein
MTPNLWGIDFNKFHYVIWKLRCKFYFTGSVDREEMIFQDFLYKNKCVKIVFQSIAPSDPQRHDFNNLDSKAFM